MLYHVKDADVKRHLDPTCHLHIDLHQVHQVECHAVIVQWRYVWMTRVMLCACRY